jgi:UDP-N-acetylmuramate: L-alanyl-gamma-D-glutamyl-meso-diaminopimelate ligase
MSTADGAVLGPVNRSQLLGDAERLSPERVVERIRAAGRQAHALGSADEIAEFLGGELRAGDVMLVLSNGSFDGLCDKLLARLSPVAAPTRSL